MKNATKIAQVSQVYKTMLKWSHFNPICTKMIWGIFTQSFDAFWGHSKILKIKEKQFLPLGVVMNWQSQKCRGSKVNKMYVKECYRSICRIIQMMLVYQTRVSLNPWKKYSFPLHFSKNIYQLENYQTLLWWFFQRSALLLETATNSYRGGEV